MQYCDYCGEELGVYERYPGEPESCGKPECNREIQAMQRAEREERQMRAEMDDYGRYQ